MLDTWGVEAVARDVLGILAICSTTSEAVTNSDSNASEVFMLAPHGPM